jgi:hypothetical protein
MGDGDIARDVILQSLQTNISSIVKGEFVNAFDQLLSKANDFLLNVKKVNKYKDMGAVVSSGMFINSNLYVSHIGDTRIYLFRNGKLNCLTEDHTYIANLIKNKKLNLEDAKKHPMRNMVLKSLGFDKEIQPDTFTFQTNSGDQFLFLTDGVYGELSDIEIESIFKYKAKSGSIKEKSRDYWTFIYLTNGLNVKDLCLLKYKDVDGNTLKFIRAKTIRQKKERAIYATLRKESLKIIEKWGNEKTSNESYVFPILQGKESAEKQRQLIQQLTHTINDNLKSIAEELGIKKPVTTYSARHSFATVLKRSGASMEVISEMLGHSNLKTTRLYLDSFEKETLEKTTNALTNFNNL